MCRLLPLGGLVILGAGFGCQSSGSYAVAFERGAIRDHVFDAVSETAAPVEAAATRAGRREIGSFVLVAPQNAEGNAWAIPHPRHEELLAELRAAAAAEAAARGATGYSVTDESSAQPDLDLPPLSSNKERYLWFTKLRVRLFREGDATPRKRDPAPASDPGGAAADFAVLSPAVYGEHEPCAARAEVLESERVAAERNLRQIGSFQLVPAENAERPELLVRRGAFQKKRLALWRAVPREAARRGATAVVIKDVSRQIEQTKKIPRFGIRTRNVPRTFTRYYYAPRLQVTLYRPGEGP